MNQGLDMFFDVRTMVSFLLFVGNGLANFFLAGGINFFDLGFVEGIYFLDEVAARNC